MKGFQDRYARKEVLSLTGYIVFEAFSTFLIYRIVSLEINNYFIAIALMFIYVVLGIYTVYRKTITSRKKRAILNNFLKVCKSEVKINNKLKVYLCSSGRLVLCLSLNYMSLSLLIIERYVEKQSERIGFSIDFTCFRLESASKVIVENEKVKDKIFIYKGIALIPNLDAENFLDRVEGVFLEAQLKDVNKEEIDRLVRIVESYVQ